jgi:pSer/pThr/pTyr-binding forkhead associated (FHA) protein
VIVVVLWRDVRIAAQRESMPVSRERPARLVVLDGEAVNEMIYSLRPFTTIGRASSNLIELSDTYCSAEHALVLWRNGQWWLEDRDSRNGTRLNGDVVESPVILSAGDMIYIGRAQMRFESEA